MALKQPSDPVKDSALPQLAKALLQLIREGPSVLEQYRQEVTRLDTDYAQAVAKVSGVEAEYAAKVAALEPIYQKKRADAEKAWEDTLEDHRSHRDSLIDRIVELEDQAKALEITHKDRVKTIEEEVSNLIASMNEKRALFKKAEAAMQAEIDSLTMKRDGLKAEVKELLARFA